MEGLGGEAIARYLDYVEAELGANVGGVIVFVGDQVSIPGAELGEGIGDGGIDGGMAGDVGGVVGQGSEGEGVLIDVPGFLGFGEHVGNEVSATHVMGQVAEEMVAEGVVADVLDEAAAVGIGVGGAHLVVGRAGKAREEHGAKLRFPEEIDDLLVGQDGVGRGALAGRQETEQNGHAQQDSPLQRYGLGQRLHLGSIPFTRQGRSISDCSRWVDRWRLVGWVLGSR